MGAESDAQLQQFTHAVYSQNDTGHDIVGQSPLGAIESRSIRFAQWQDSVAGEADGVPEIPERLLRHWVDGDIASFRLLSALDEEIAADNISANFQNYQAYRAEMQLLAGDVADKVDALKKESLRRGIEQDRVTAKDLVARARDTDAQAKLPKDTSGLNGFSGGEPSPDFSPERLIASKVLESISYKTRPDGSVLYLVSERPAFIDHGRHIIVEDKALEDEESILGAILLAKEKYGGAFSLTGTEEFKRKALEVMLKNNIEVRLKSPAQEMLLKEMAAAYPDYKLPTPMPKHVQGATVDSVSDLPSIEAPDAVVEMQGHGASEQTKTEPVQSPIAPELPDLGPTSDSPITPVSATDWWQLQRQIVSHWCVDDKDRVELLKQLGAEPPAGSYYWFDKNGNQVSAPSNANELLHKHAVQQESIMSEQSAGPEKSEERKPILRGVVKVGDDYDTNVLLFKGKGDYLQGFVKVDGVKHQVIAHVNERKPNPETGEIKPNFIKLSKSVGEGENTKWEEIGFGNALNKRNDGKPVYFDDVLFNIGGKTVGARVTKYVDEEMHRKLGFVEKRVPRPDRGPEADADSKMKAPAATPEVQQPQAAASAPSASDAKKPRNRARG
ncbi:LPD7 domain-containing protein [Pseudomonas monteilii]|uniref:LPD7 domain-containing protein n=1 Tax=Pseudomonas monteilii TaxID=76759 RepID=UPI0015F7E3D6|nr:LPD7 domain-containing protein [Pseudomonas monteilii]MBA6106013.1 hypothetical protein [Pseudomonas monteilii]